MTKYGSCSRRGLQLFWLVLCVCAAALFAALSAVPRSPSQSNSSYAYVGDGLGRFLKIRLENSHLVGVVQLDDVLSLTQSIRPDSCLVCQARYVAQTHRAFVLVAREARLSADSTRHYDIAVFEIPSFKEIGRIHLSEPLAASPSLVLSPDGKSMLVSYQVSGGPNIAVYDAVSLRRLADLNSSVLSPDTATSALYFDQRATLSVDGMIRDGYNTARISDNQVSLSSSNPYELLFSSPEKFQGYLIAGHIELGLADFAGDQLLLTLNAGLKAPQGVVVVDIRTKNVSDVIPLERISVSSAHLSPDAKRIIVEELDPTARRATRTGVLRIFDLAGKCEGTIDIGLLRGPASPFIGVSPSGRIALYATGKKLLLVDLITREVTGLDTPFELTAKGSQLMFTDQ